MEKLQLDDGTMTHREMPRDWGNTGQQLWDHYGRSTDAKLAAEGRCRARLKLGHEHRQKINKYLPYL